MLPELSVKDQVTTVVPCAVIGKDVVVVPLIVPGERINEERLNWIQSQSLYNEDLVNSYIRVLNQ